MFLGIRYKTTIILLLFWVAISARAEDKKNFIVGVQDYKQYQPYSFIKEKKYQGFNRVLLDMFAESKGYHFQYKPYPIKRLLNNLIYGKVDFKYPDMHIGPGRPRKNTICFTVKPWFIILNHRTCTFTWTTLGTSINYFSFFGEPDLQKFLRNG